MLKDDETQYCSMCLEWANKCEELELANERLKEELESFKMQETFAKTQREANTFINLKLKGY